MFGWLKKPFKPRPTTAPSSSAKIEGCRWIAPADNEFAIEVCDCSAFCQSMLSATADPSVATKFLELRSSDGAELRSQLPQNAVSANCELTYPFNGERNEGPLFKAQEMEDKWDIYLYESMLYFTRSWTGDLVYCASITFDSSVALIREVIADQMRSQPHEYSIAVVDYLMKSHLYRKSVPHPLPPDFPRDTGQIGLFSFSQFGRWARFATFADSTKIRITP